MLHYSHFTDEETGERGWLTHRRVPEGRPKSGSHGPGLPVLSGAWG